MGIKHVDYLIALLWILLTEAVILTWFHIPLFCTAFSVNFNSAGWGSLRAGKAKNMHHRGALFRGQGGNGVRDMTLPLMGNLGAKGTSLIFANLQTIAGGKKCCFRQ